MLRLNNLPTLVTAAFLLAVTTQAGLVNGAITPPDPPVFNSLSYTSLLELSHSGTATQTFTASVTNPNPEVIFVQLRVTVTSDGGVNFNTASAVFSFNPGQTKDKIDASLVLSVPGSYSFFARLYWGLSSTSLNYTGQPGQARSGTFLLRA